MKAWIALVAWEGNRVTKYQDFDTKVEAEAHVAKFGGFVAPNPGGLGERPKYWLVDMVAKTIGYDDALALLNHKKKDWRLSMVVTDLEMPRWFEDAVDEGSVVLKPGRVKDNYDVKKAIRAKKP